MGAAMLVLEEEIMAGYASSSRWVMVLGVLILLAAGASAATHTQTVVLQVQGMV
jgi:hypothetical protein